MSSLLKQSIHSSIASTFYADVLSQRNMYYYFLGKTLTWNSNDLPDDILDTIDAENDVRNNVIYMKRINASDISFVIPRINWQSNTVYDRYDANVSATNPSSTGATSIKNAKFYVLTSEMNVYKCIHNNYGAPSTVKPTGTDYDTITTSDGYIWKFMYSIPPSLQYRFLTETQIPVLTSLSARYYRNLGIDEFTIHDGGSGYSDETVTTLLVVGDGSGAKLVPGINPKTGSIEKVHIADGGAGYTTATIQIIAVDNKGAGLYDNNPTAILIPRIKNGSIVAVTVVDPGYAYTTNSQTTLVVSGTGQGAELHPIVYNGEIVDVIISNAGAGYSEATVSVESFTGSGAAITINTGIGNIDSIQSDVELLTTPGAVYVVDPVTTGVNYSYASCVVYGDGTGLQVTPVLYNGTVVKYDVTDVGSGYTWCDIRVVGDGTGATAKALLSPYKGHGHDAVAELFADSISMYATIKLEPNQGIMVSNDYRQFGIMRNPEKFTGQGLYRELTGSTCHRLQVDSAANVNADDVLVLSTDHTKKFVVVHSDHANTLIVQDFSGVNLVPGNRLVKLSDNSTTLVQLVTRPQIDKKSGDLLFIDNRYPIFQTSDQFISLRTTLKF